MRYSRGPDRFHAGGVGSRRARLFAAQNDDVEVLGGHEVLRAHLERGRGYLLDAFAAEADQAVGLALVDDKAEVLDRAGPVGAGLQHIADTSFHDFRLVGLVGAGELVERLQEIVRNAVIRLVARNFGLQRLLLAQALPQHRIETDADAGLVAVLDRDRLARRKRLLAHHRGLQGPTRLIEGLALVIGARLRQQALGNRAIPGRLGKLGDLELLGADRQDRDTHAAQRRGYLLGVEEGSLVDGEIDRLAVNLGGKTDEIDWIAGREGHVRIVRKIDVGQRKRDRERDRVRALVEEDIAHGYGAGRNGEVFRLDRNVGILGEDQTAKGRLGRGVVGAG